MENNQQSSGERNHAGQQSTTTRNERQGQELPAKNVIEKANNDKPSRKERHSESSLPESDNETLGIP